MKVVEDRAINYYPTLPVDRELRQNKQPSGERFQLICWLKTSGICAPASASYAAQMATTIQFSSTEAVDLLIP